MADTFFSLDLSESYIKVLDAEKSGNMFDVLSLGFVPALPNFYSGDTEKIIFSQADAVAKLVSDAKIKKRNVNIIIPDTVSYSQIIEMPILNEKELLSAIKYQADQFIPLPIDETSLDIEILFEDKKNRKNTVLIVATSQTTIAKIEKLTEASGLIPQTVETELSAMSRLFSEFYKEKNENSISIIANFGFSSTTLSLFDHKNSLLIQTHSFNIGYELFAKELRQNLNLDTKKIEEILRTFGFSQNSSYNVSELLSPALNSFLKQIEKFVTVAENRFKLKIQKIVFTDEVIRINEFTQKIESYFKIPTVIIDLSLHLKKNPMLDAVKYDLPLFTASFGGNL